jgi:hypothetical protein
MSPFRADCSSCCGLCCVAPDLLAVQGFGVDKPAEKPCVHLNAHQRCSIHAARLIHGFAACEGFDCFGAGQWITQNLFGGAKWTDSPDLASRMFAAYRHWAPRFAAAALLEAALPYVREDARVPIARLMAELTCGETVAHLRLSDAARLRRETLALIRASLKGDPDLQVLASNSAALDGLSDKASQAPYDE